MKQCTNCPGRTDHNTPDCPMRPAVDEGWLDLLEETAKHNRVSPGLLDRINGVLKKHGRAVRRCPKHGHAGPFCGAPDCWLRET